MTYESYKAYLSVTSSNPSEEYKDFFKHLVEEDFDDSATIMTVNHNGAEVKVRVVRVFTKEALNRPINNLKKIIFNNFDYEVSVGDIFYFDDKQWLCIDTGKTLYSRSCTVAKCHDTLKFYKSEISTNIVEIPYFVLDNIALTRMGYDDSRYMTLPYSRMLVMIANNEINREVSRDDVYKLKGYDNYEVVDINRIRFDGLIILELEYSQKTQEEYIYELTILNGESIQISEIQELTIIAQLKVNNVVVDNPSLLFFSSDEEIATIDNNGVVTVIDTGIVTFMVSLTSDSSVSSNIEVEIVEEEIDNITYEIIGVSDIYYGYSEQYVAKKFNNGVLVPDAEFTFSILGDAPASVYTLEVDSDTECTITANQVTYNIILRAADNENGEFVEKNITLRNLF